MNRSSVLYQDEYSLFHLFSSNRIALLLIYFHEPFCSTQLLYFGKMKLSVWKMNLLFFTILFMKYQDTLAFVRNLGFSFINSLLLSWPFLYSLFKKLSQSFLCLITFLLNMMKGRNRSIFILPILLNKLTFSLIKNCFFLIINLFFLILQIIYLSIDWRNSSLSMANDLIYMIIPIERLVEFNLRFYRKLFIFLVDIVYSIGCVLITCGNTYLLKLCSFFLLFFLFIELKKLLSQLVSLLFFI